MTTHRHQTKHIYTVPTVLLLLGLFFASTVYATRYIDYRYQEYYLTGTLEEEADFNFNLSAGQSVQSNLTIINNDDTVSNTYSIAGVDSEINNQQQIVFKAVESDNANIGQWTTFETTTVTVEPKTHVTIPFTINIPADVFPGTYFGGISITKINKKAPIESASNLSVNVQTRTVLEMKINIDGTLNKSFNVENFYFDTNKNGFVISIKNTGNVIMSFGGELTNNTSSLLENKTEIIKTSPFKILPGATVSQTVKYHAAPLFGQFNASIKGDMSYFNGVMNQYEIFDTLEAQSETKFFNWPIIFIALGVLILLILLISLNLWLQQKYLKECTEYTVQPDDTLTSIATTHQMNWKKLARINKLEAPYTLVPKQKILVHEKKNS